MTLHIEELKVQAVIGIFPEERLAPQTILIEGEFSYPFKGKYLDYVDIREFIVHSLQEGKFGLLEEALTAVHDGLKRQFSELSAVKLKFQKPDILSDCSVGASLERRYL